MGISTPSGPGLAVLVVADRLNVTGEHLGSSQLGFDQRGRPAVEFAMTFQGGRRFEMLTGSNLPSDAPTFCRRLAIILNGQALSAPSIKATIRDQGIIEGVFTHEEVRAIVAALQSGTLPARLVPLGERPADAEE